MRQKLGLSKCVPSGVTKIAASRKHRLEGPVTGSNSSSGSESEGGSAPNDDSRMHTRLVK